MTNIFFNKIVTRPIFPKILIIATLTLLMIASTAAGAGAVTIDSVTFTPYPLIVGEPFTVTVQVSDFHPEDTVYFTTPNKVDRVSIGSTGTAFIGGRAVNNPGTYDYSVQVWHQLSPYTYITEASQKGTITVTVPPVKPTPKITWNNPADIICGTALRDTQLNAVATDPVTGNTIPGTFAYTPASGTVLSAGVKTLHVDFTPTNTAYYNITSKEVTINVLKAIPVLNWNNPADIKYGTALSSTQLCATSLVIGTFVYTPSTGTILNAGTQTLHVDFTPIDTANYNTASKEVTINVIDSRITPAITWNNPSDIVYGTALSESQLNASASVSGTFIYTPRAGTVLDAGTQTLHVDFIPTDTTNYSNASKNITINVTEKPVLPVANFSVSISEGYAPLNVQFNDLSANATSVKWDFGDGNNSTERNPVHEYSDPGTYTINLTASNTNGTDSKLATITVSEKPAPVLPIANFSVNTTEGKAPLTVQFTDLSTNTTSVKWDFGDGNNSDDQNPVHEFTIPGTYKVSLTASNANGTDSKLAKITVSEKPVSLVADFSASQISGNTPLNVTFTDNSLGKPTAWKWSFGDGNTSTIQNPTHTYFKVGTYTVALTVGNTAGSNTTTKTNYIKVTAAATKTVASFTSNVTSGKVPLNVAFTDKSTGIPTEWKWTFGDGTSSPVQNPTHKYSKMGNYTVSLAVSNAAGSNKTTKTNYINVTILKAPIADFSAVPTTGNSPLKVNFTDKSSNMPNSWEWSFGDGTSSTNKNPVHIYSKAGNYAVSLKATNAAGTNTKAIKNYIIVKTAPIKPIAAFSATPTSGKAPLKVQFTDKSTNNPTSWKWSFGDGKSSTQKNPSYTYSKAGKYTVALIATNAAGSSTLKKSNYINVVAVTKPIAAFSASPMAGKHPLNVKFTDKSTGSPTSWSWNFGDKSISTAQNPTHKYTKAGKYTVTLTVKNAAGSNTKTMSNYITVK